MIVNAKTIRRHVCAICSCAIGVGGLCSYACIMDSREKEKRPEGSVLVAIYTLTETRPYVPFQRAAPRRDEGEVD